MGGGGGVSVCVCVEGARGCVYMYASDVGVCSVNC